MNVLVAMAVDSVAFRLGSLSVRWYGVCVALGFLAGFLLLDWRARRRGVAREAASDLVLAAMVGGIVGARLLYVFENWSEFGVNPLEILRIDHGGLVFFGGLFGGAVAAWFAIRRKRLALGQVADLAAPALALGHAVGRIGCYLNGCCFGHAWNGPLALQYPADSGAIEAQIREGALPFGAGAALPAFPIQLVETLANLAIVAALLAIGSRRARSGQLVFIYMVLYGVARFFIEFGRGDYPRHFGPFTPAQVVCLLLVPAGVGGVLWIEKRARRQATS